ncbi:MAG: hypothetical protein H0T79_19770 [Deltaproteobacteria bacterium]|nr:hypothetical protein [Deltaproteobacteria bacterium]
MAASLLYAVVALKTAHQRAVDGSEREVPLEHVTPGDRLRVSFARGSSRGQRVSRGTSSATLDEHGDAGIH